MKHGPGIIMFRGCFAASGTGQIQKVDGILRKEHYVEILYKAHNLDGILRKEHYLEILYKAHNEILYKAHLAIKHNLKSSVTKLKLGR